MDKRDEEKFLEILGTDPAYLGSGQAAEEA